MQVPREYRICVRMDVWRVFRTRVLRDWKVRTTWSNSLCVLLVFEVEVEMDGDGDVGVEEGEGRGRTLRFRGREGDRLLGLLCVVPRMREESSDGCDARSLVPGVRSRSRGR